MVVHDWFELENPNQDIIDDFGIDPTIIGVKYDSHEILTSIGLDEFECKDIVVGCLKITTSDSYFLVDRIDHEVRFYPNFLYTTVDWTDLWVRYYYFRPLTEEEKKLEINKSY